MIDPLARDVSLALAEHEVLSRKLDTARQLADRHLDREVRRALVGELRRLAHQLNIVGEAAELGAFEQWGQMPAARLFRHVEHLRALEAELNGRAA